MINRFRSKIISLELGDWTLESFNTMWMHLKYAKDTRKFQSYLVFWTRLDFKNFNKQFLTHMRIRVVQSC
jgi:hypothetical protein